MSSRTQRGKRRESEPYGTHRTESERDSETHNHRRRKLNAIALPGSNDKQVAYCSRLTAITK
eukprot:scaffold87249_cov43-Attheya_sp.AAC.1